MRERSIASITRLFALAAMVLLVLAACSKKEPSSSMPAAGGTSASGTTPSWTPEANPTPSLEVQSSADVYNKQGVLRRIHFETNKWDILPGDRAILKENAAWLLAHTQFKVTVEGHCDERNTEAYNLALGERRANAAKEYLIGLGVPADKIQTVSYGKSRPLCTEHDESCWQQNRRDEFVLQDAK
jgi:peptidoglycan-associated lipoprotein